MYFDFKQLKKVYICVDQKHFLSHIISPKLWE